MSNPYFHRNTTDTTSNNNDDNDYDPQSPLDVLVNLLLLVATLTVVSLVYYIMCYIMLHVQSSSESAATEAKRAKRAAFIEENLLVHEWVDDSQGHEEETEGQENGAQSAKQELTIQCSGHDELASQVRTKASEVGNDDDSACSTVSLDSSFDGCAICLAEYKQNQKVCESSNPACTHMFHEECMVNWLMKHHRCPICRQRYIAQTP
jgi:hypothetical protein